MMVIKESHESIMRRRNLEAEKRRILNLDFKKKSDRSNWDRLNGFLKAKSDHPPNEGQNEATKGFQSFETPEDGHDTPQLDQKAH